MFTFYKVGGCVRDKIMGIDSKDIDYTVVADDSIKHNSPEYVFKLLSEYLKEKNYTIFLETPACFTIRAKFPPNHQFSGVADFELARKELEYIDGTRQPVSVLGSLYDDLERRDFTINAIAEDVNGNYIDPFDGIRAIKAQYLTTPKSVIKSFDDDPLRILRAIRFSITKELTMTYYMNAIIHSYDYDNKMSVVSVERIREELEKCFKYDCIKTLEILMKYKNLYTYIFTKTKLKLYPTLKEK